MKQVSRLFSLVIALCIIFAYFPVTVWERIKTEASGITVTLDPGHGGSDPGTTAAAAYGGHYESWYNLEIAKATKARLEKYGIKVYMTRSDDTYLSLSSRVEIASQNGSDAIISIHNNSSSNSSVYGSALFGPNPNYDYEMYTESHKMGVKVLEKLASSPGMKNRGYVYNNASSTYYPDGSLADYYAINRYAKTYGIDISFIVECGFCSNQSDVAILENSDQRTQIGYSIADGIAEYYGLKSEETEATQRASVAPSATAASSATSKPASSAQPSASASTASSDKGNAYKSGWYRVTTDLLNVRSQPDTVDGAEIIGELHTDDVIQVLEIKNTFWGQIEYEGSVGYASIHTKYAEYLGEEYTPAVTSEPAISEEPAATVEAVVQTPAETPAPIIEESVPEDSDPIDEERYNSEEEIEVELQNKNGEMSSEQLHEKGLYKVVLSGSVNNIISIRSMPSEYSVMLGTVSVGSYVYVTAVDGDWGYINHNGVCGWIELEDYTVLDYSTDTNIVDKLDVGSCSHEQSVIFKSNSTVAEAISEFKNITRNEDVTVINAAGEETELSEILATGMVIEAGEDRYNVIIYADVNGDGTADVSDLTEILQHMRGTVSLSDQYADASYVTEEYDGILSVVNVMYIFDEIIS
ncbi:MAG: N-acetylmuramoyl-L-alanine amidase [Clostridia bacterium]|nr:N-acetylmuramoyl-L-alanine amidase [Clostridia bacterium]